METSRRKEISEDVEVRSEFSVSSREQAVRIGEGKEVRDWIPLGDAVIDGPVCDSE